MELTKNWRKSFFTIYTGQAFSLLSSSAIIITTGYIYRKCAWAE